MANVERGVVKPANMPGAAGDRRNNSFLPLGGGALTVHPANQGPGGDRRGGSFPLGGGARRSAIASIDSTSKRFWPRRRQCRRPSSREARSRSIRSCRAARPLGRRRVSDEAKARPGR